jgi:hypothetical protein
VSKGGGPSSGGLLGGLGKTFGSTGGGGFLGSLSGLMGGFGMAMQGVQVAAELIGKIGLGRKTADALVPAQNAFSTEIEALLKPLRAENAAGKLNPTDVLEAHKQIEQTIADFKEQTQKFEAMDPTHAKVYEQMYATLLPYITNVRGEVDAMLGAIPGGGAPGAPMGAPATGAWTIQTLNLTVNPQITLDTTLDRRTVRDDVIPEFMDELKTGLNGVREQLAQIVRDSLAGVTSTRPATA